MRIPSRALLIGATSAALLLAGCGGSQGTDAGDSGDLKLSLITGSAGAYYEAMACGATKAADELGASIDVQYPDAFDPTKSESLIRSASVAQPDGMVIVPTDASALNSALQAAKSAGIELVAADQSLDDPSLVESTVVTDNVAAGAAAADAMAKAVGSGKVIIDGAAPGASAVADRVNGFKDQIKAEYPDIEVVGVEYSMGDAKKASAIVNGALAKHPDLKGVYTIYEVGAIGIGSAIKAAGKTGELKMVGFDTAPTIMEMLEDGVVTATIAQQPAEMGYKAVESLVDAIGGGSPDAEVEVPFLTIDESNLSDPKVQTIVNASADKC
jgi:ribose transport system substrate-binding protein